MMTVRRILLSLMAIASLVSFSHAATIQAIISGLPEPSLVESITVDLAVAATFNYTADSLQVVESPPAPPPPDATPSRISGVHLAGWDFGNRNPTVSPGGIFRVDMFNADVFDFTAIPDVSNGQYDENNLLNGVLFLLDTENGLADIADRFPGFEIFNASGDPIALDGAWADVSVEVVPIPASVLLLGSGLAGLAAFRRRRART